MTTHVDNPFESPSVLSICTGMRGIETGVERVIGPVRIAAYVEIEAFIIENLIRQMEQSILAAAPVWTDVKTFPGEPFHNKVQWIFGGYPCQPFSLAGNQKGSSDPRHLWPFIKTLIRIIRPSGCFFENVVNHLNIGYREVRRDLEEMDYTVKEGIYSAQEVGAPHRRERLFIFAMDNTISQQTFGYYQSRFHQMPGRTGQILGHSDSINRGLPEPGERIKDIKTTGRSETVGNALGPGLEGYAGNEHSGGGQPKPSGPISPAGSLHWPAGQGDYQHEWEEPRVIKSGLGCTVDGYNFRTDLLRMYGNGVVPATTELAFEDLLRKHFCPDYAKMERDIDLY